ncbi:MAG: class I SAM-dependent methyltransferase [Candidatus Thermoplasmatota archaeon]|nr:class I SAM-dependent methyltransferase [Candidatus Thermoplasmatota archaeon]
MTDSMARFKEVDLEEKKVLDAGTGACGMTKILEDKGAEVVSVDIERERMIDCRSQTESTDFLQADLSNMRFIESESFDHVFCKGTVSALSINKTLFVTSVLRELHRILKNGGQLTIIDYYPFEEESSPVPLDEHQVELWRLEKAVFELLGEGHLEEYSPELLKDELRSIGFGDVTHSIFRDELPWSDELLKEHEEVILENIELIEEEYLGAALKKKLRDIISSTEKKKVVSGAQYELNAKR